MERSQGLLPLLEYSAGEGPLACRNSQNLVLRSHDFCALAAIVGRRYGLVAGSPLANAGRIFLR